MTIDLNLIRGYLDEIGVATQVDEDGDLIVVQGADDDFAHNVVIFITVNNNRLSYAAGSPGYEPKGDLYMLANRHNCTHHMPTAVVRNDAIRMEYSFLLDEEVSKEYIVENCIKMMLGSMWRSFVTFEQEA